MPLNKLVFRSDLLTLAMVLGNVCLMHASGKAQRRDEKQKSACPSQPPSLGKEFWYFGCWADASSKMKAPFICQRVSDNRAFQGAKSDFSTTESDSAAILGEAIINKMSGGCSGDPKWVWLDGFCYRLFRHLESFWSADNYCSQQGVDGHLAAITSDAANMLVSKLCTPDLLDGCFIGLHKRSSSLADKVWTWTNGSDVLYRNWFHGQPKPIGWESPRDGEEVTIINWHHVAAAPNGLQSALQGVFGIAVFATTCGVSICCWCCCHPERSGSQHADSQHQIDVVDATPIMGLRAISAICIATGHCFGQQTSSPLDFQGGFAVTIFMFISGFIMVVVYADQCSKPGFDKKFLGRRVARLFPVHWLALLLSYPLLRYSLPQLPPAVLIPAVVLSIPTTFALVQSWWSPVLILGGNGAAWTMSTFLFFYLAFGPLARQLHRHYSGSGVPHHIMVLTCFAAILFPLAWYSVLLLLGYDEFTTYMGARAHPFARMPLFYLGMLVGMKAKQPHREHSSLREDLETSSEQLLGPTQTRINRRFANLFSVLLLLLWITAMCLEMILREQALRIRGGLELACIPILPVWVHNLTRARSGITYQILAHPILKAIGEWSFSLYLLQLPIWDITRFLIFGNLRERLPAYSAPFLLAEALFLAAICHRYVEEPCRRQLAKCFETSGSVGVRPLELVPVAMAHQELLFNCPSCSTTNKVIQPSGRNLSPTQCVCGMCGTTFPVM